MDTQQVSVLYDALLALIDRWPPHLQPAVLRDLGEQAVSGLPKQRLAEHSQRWLNRLPGLAPSAYDDLLEHIATHFAAVPADDGLAVFQRLVELSRTSSRPILSLLARQLEGLPAALRNRHQRPRAARRQWTRVSAAWPPEAPVTLDKVATLAALAAVRSIAF